MDFKIVNFECRMLLFLHDREEKSTLVEESNKDVVIKKFSLIIKCINADFGRVENPRISSHFYPLLRDKFLWIFMTLSELIDNGSSLFSDRK